MAAIGTVWGTLTWPDDIWGDDTWGAAAATTVINKVVYGVTPLATVRTLTGDPTTRTLTPLATIRTLTAEK